MQGVHVAVVVVLVAGVLSGCMGSDGGAPKDPDAPSSVLVEPEPGLRIAANRGAVRGVVSNDAGTAVPGARVLLVGTDAFADTPDDGSFRFLNVTRGPHTLRVEKPGFQAYERDLVVADGQVAVVDPVLLPDADVGAGYAAHVHDYWGDRERALLMDEPVELAADTGDSVVNANFNSGDAYDYPFFLPERTPDGQVALVYPGAARVEVTLTWSSDDVNLPALGLKYAPANEPQRTTLPPQASGTPFLIDVGPGMSDAGHQLFTLWEFYVTTGNDVRNAPSWQPGAVLGPVDVRVEAVKGIVALEPEHPAFWAGSDQLLLRDPANPYAFNWGVQENDRRTSSSGPITLDKGKIVPPGTTRLRLEFSWGASGPVPPPDEDWVLTWRTAAQDPRTTLLAQYARADPVSEGPGSKVYEFAVAEGESDAFYQGKSLWRFLPSRAGTEDDPAVYHDARLHGYSFRLGVTAFKDV
jgi:hypothetical protein